MRPYSFFLLSCFFIYFIIIIIIFFGNIIRRVFYFKRYSFVRGRYYLNGLMIEPPLLLMGDNVEPTSVHHSQIIIQVLD